MTSCENVKDNVTPPEFFDKSIRGIEPFLTAKELAEILRINKGTVANWVCYKRGFPVHRIGAHNRFRLSEVLEFLKEE